MILKQKTTTTTKMMYLPKILRSESFVDHNPFFFLRFDCYKFSNPQPPHLPLYLYIKGENSNLNLILKFFEKRSRCYGNVII